MKFYTGWPEKKRQTVAGSCVNAIPHCNGCSPAGRRVRADAGPESSLSSFCAAGIIPYAIERYQVETQRLYNVLNKRWKPPVAGRRPLCADIASWPWVNAHQRQRIDLDTYPAVYSWF